MSACPSFYRLVSACCLGEDDILIPSANVWRGVRITHSLQIIAQHMKSNLDVI